ncbi:uncharacterized protein DNG_04320 [Cephalotrichum gorgonifer]|uniref:Uncharacterized protein n=1 Tax=Cephalotrichum gorgonifer TaxID=2041049 RepID=A0AAE8MYN0_9PEZI|nr:uncharacterized protein DNG_04320 [Cephalotrichum gorgonifer]
MASPTSPKLSLLEDLPLHVFEGICEHLAVHRGKPEKRSLSALAATSRWLSSATARLQFQAIQLHFEDIPALHRDVERWTQILDARDCWRYVQRLCILEKEKIDEWDDEDDQKEWPPDRVDDFFERVSHEVWPMDKDDEFWTRPEPIAFNPWGPFPSTPEGKAEKHGAWDTVVGLVTRLPGLRDVDYECKSQVPPNLLRALNEKNGGPVRLHISGFSLRSLYQDPSKPHDIDEDEWYLATSPCLSSIRLLVPCHLGQSRGVDNDRRVDFNEDAVGQMVAGLAPNLKSVSVDSTYSPRGTAEDFTWLGFFPGRSPDSGQRRKGALETLAVESGVDADVDTLQAWSGYTDFNLLRSLHLRTSAIRVPELNALSDICETDGLGSLRSLSLWTAVSWGDDNEVVDNVDAELAKLLSALKLESIELKGPFLDETFDAVLSRGASLRRLKLIPERDYDLQRLPFVFTRKRVEALAQACPNIQDLELLIPRSKGDEEEVRIYNAIGSLPQLDRLSLLLDCSNIRAAEQEVDSDSDLADPSICDAIINLTTDRRLATDIFDAICLHRSPRLIRIYPDGMGNFGTDVLEWSMIFIRNCLARAWIRRRDDRWGHEGQFQITEVRSKSEVSSRRELITGEFHRALAKVWPEARWPANIEMMESFPLWKPA